MLVGLGFCCWLKSEIFHHWIWTRHNNTHNNLHFTDLILIYNLKRFIHQWVENKIWPGSVNTATGSETGRVVSITHSQGLICCHTHGSSWETAGLPGPADTQIWKGLTNYWGEGYGGSCETVWICRKLSFLKNVAEIDSKAGLFRQQLVTTIGLMTFRWYFIPVDLNGSIIVCFLMWLCEHKHNISFILYGRQL